VRYFNLEKSRNRQRQFAQGSEFLIISDIHRQTKGQRGRFRLHDDVM
jgi:hypothetical protein